MSNCELAHVRENKSLIHATNRVRAGTRLQTGMHTVGIAVRHRPSYQEAAQYEKACIVGPERQ